MFTEDFAGRAPVRGARRGALSRDREDVAPILSRFERSVAVFEQMLFRLIGKWSDELVTHFCC
jgi:hypothetical protein